MRVLYLAHTFSVGGAEEMALNLVRHLPPRFSPAACAIREAGPIGGEIRQAGVPVAELGLLPGLRRPADVLRLRDAIHGFDPDIVHTFLLTGSLYGRFAAMLARVPVIVGTEVNIYERKHPLHVWAERWLMRGTDAVVASAASVRDFYVAQIDADPSRVEVVYNAVDWSRLETTRTRAEVRAEAGVPADATLLCIVARLTEQKGHGVLFEALARHQGLGQAHVLIVGDGELSGELRAGARRLGLDDRAHFVGARRDLGNLLGASDVFVMPSFWEGLPLSLVLAMGAGLPVVATRVAGIPEVVADGETGLLVPPGDSAALGDALARVVADPAFAGSLGAAARAFALPRFGIERYVDSVTSIYDRLLAAKGLP